MVQPQYYYKKKIIRSRARFILKKGKSCHTKYIIKFTLLQWLLLLQTIIFATLFVITAMYSDFSLRWLLGRFSLVFAIFVAQYCPMLDIFVYMSHLSHLQGLGHKKKKIHEHPLDPYWCYYPHMSNDSVSHICRI